MALPVLLSPRPAFFQKQISFRNTLAALTPGQHTLLADISQAGNVGCWPPGSLSVSLFRNWAVVLQLRHYK
jgi:hypothetical protein